MASPKYELRDELATIGSAWANAAPQGTAAPTITSYLVKKEVLSTSGHHADLRVDHEYNFRIDVEADSFATAESLAAAIREYDQWPWPLIFLDEKDDARMPEDSSDIKHVISLLVQLHAE